MGTKVAGDFLKRDAKTPFSGHYLAAGTPLKIATNFEPILQIARESFEEAQPGSQRREGIRLRFWVENSSHADAIRSKPYFRGLDHLVFAGFDARNSLLINLRDRHGLGRFTPDVAADKSFWKTLVFPVLLTALGPSVGLTPLHCACVAWKGSGLLLAGESGSGKSTLSLALAQGGFDFLSDDRALVTDQQGRLLAWSLFTEMKHRVDAVEHFPALKGIIPGEIGKGEKVFRFDPIQLFNLSHVQCCEPRWVVFLERQPEPLFSLTELVPDEAARRLEKDLHRETPETQEQQRHTIDALAGRACYRLRYGGNPHTIAGVLRCLVAEGWKTRKVISPIKWRAPVEAPYQDPLRRFRATPLGSEVLLTGRVIRLETDSPTVLTHACRVLNCLEGVGGRPSQFLWKIVTEPGEETSPSWPAMTAFSEKEVRYINLGQRSFVAVDLQAREAVGVIPEHLASDEPGFSSVFLASMFYLTAPALGLVPVSAACVANGGNGLLLFGPPNNGKTTSIYRSTKRGLVFHADQASFLELETGKLRAWGDFWPAAFRPETAQFLPELSILSRSFSYRDRTFLCLDKAVAPPSKARSVIPVACIFLERRAGTSPKLIPLSHQEAGGRFVPRAPFRDDAGSECDREEVYRALRSLPAYRLLYGDDPSEAVVFFQSVLRTHHLMEDRS